MTKEYRQVEWDAALEDDCRQLVRLAAREDLDRLYDWTTVALAPEDATGRAAIVAREPGVLAGIQPARIVLEEYDAALELEAFLTDGAALAPGTRIGLLRGAARSLLTVERPLLNLLGRLCGVATLARRYVDAVAGSRARIYDTRKTMPGWRRLDKLAVRAGGAWNHRLGLFDGVLIKDNHLAFSKLADSPGRALDQARRFVREMGRGDADLVFEVEVDSIAQLRDVLPHEPDIVLLDNMPPDALSQAVALRDELAPGVSLEASGGVRLDTVAAIAATGVDRISVGELTHSARWLDVGLDWLAEDKA